TEYPTFQLNLNGLAIPKSPTARLTVNGNNLGGVRVAGGIAETGEMATITNDGADPLRITAVNMIEGTPSYTLTGVPADLATNPVVLATGKSFTFGIKFVPAKVGLQRALINVATNDSLHPVLRVGATGTGLDRIVYPSWGHNYVALETP